MSIPTQQYKETFWKLYEKLPHELKDALLAEETGDTVYETVERNDAMEQHGAIVDLTGQVLIGLLLPPDFAQKIQGLGVKKEAAEIIAREINRIIFYPVKPALEQLHQMEIKVTAKVVTPKPEEERKEQPPEKPSGPDHYREEIE